MPVVSTSTTTESYTGSGVLPAEDAGTRNRILFAVIGSIVGLSFVIAVVFLFIRRRHSKLDSSADFRDNEVLPPIQPDMNQSEKKVAHKMDVAPTQLDPAVAENPAGPTGVTASNFTFSDDMSQQKRFREQQLLFKEKREKERRKARGVSPEPNVSPKGSFKAKASASFSLPNPSSYEEKEVLDILSSNIDRDIKHKHGIYKDLVMQWHPDKHSDDKLIATKVFQFLQTRKEWFLGNQDGALSP
jgi:hypothetical protein